MSKPRILIRVNAADLPEHVRALLDPTRARPAQARFQVRRTHVSWSPAAWLIGFLVVGTSSAAATITAGLSEQTGAERIVYGTMTAICFVAAIFCARVMLRGLAEFRDHRRGYYRQGLHVLGDEGLLIAGRDEHTWVPLALMPPPIDVTPPGSRNGKSFAFIIVDDFERMERLDCGFFTKRDLWLWSKHGILPEGRAWR